MKRSVVDKEIARAFELWSNVTPLNFIPKSEGKVHIDIKFVVGDHNDGDPFDGPGNILLMFFLRPFFINQSLDISFKLICTVSFVGGVLAHAYFPQFSGAAHFDDQENWSVNSYSGTNLFQVASHELGHS